MNWYHREERRYVEYGSSFSASRRFGIARQLTDTVFNMNAEHLPADVPTVFESLDDAGVRTAGTTYLMYRGRHEHQISRETALTRLASTVMRRSVMGPKELFYADIFASRETGCRSQLGLPGIRDQHAGCVGTYLVEHDLFDFLLLSLPDNDTHSHKQRPARPGHVDRERRPPARAHVPRRRRGRRVPRRARGDRRRRPLARAGRAAHRARRRLRRLPPAAAERRRAATRPRSRCARRSARRWSTRCCPRAATQLVPRLVDAARGARGRRPRDVAPRAARGRDPRRDAASCASPPAATCATRAAGAGRSTGRSRSSTPSVRDGVLRAPTYPDALARVWAALDVRDVGRRPAVRRRRAGSSPTGAASTTSAAAATARCTAATRSARSRSAASRRPTRDRLRRWSIADVAPMIRAHFGARADVDPRPMPVRAALRAVAARGARPRAARGARRGRAGPDGRLGDARRPRPPTTQTDPNAAVPVPRHDQAAARATG